MAVMKIDAPMTFEEANRLAFSKGFDAGNESCRAAGRAHWAPEDVAVASRAHHATLRSLGFADFLPVTDTEST